MIIPALDVLQNQIVRLYQGKYETAQFYPFKLEKRLQEYATSGATKLHLVDLEGARDPSKKQWQLIQSALKGLKAPFQIGGGIRSESDISTWLDAGAAQVVIGSMAVENQQTVSQWIKLHGPNRFVIALDVNKTEAGWAPATHGWLEDSKISLFELIAYYRSLGINDFLCTDISKDGTMSGPSFTLYQDILNHFPSINVQASGGVSSLADISALKKMGVSGIILGKSLLDNAFTIGEAINVK